MTVQIRLRPFVSEDRARLARLRPILEFEAEAWFSDPMPVLNPYAAMAGDLLVGAIGVSRYRSEDGVAYLAHIGSDDSGKFISMATEYVQIFNRLAPVRKVYCEVASSSVLVPHLDLALQRLATYPSLIFHDGRFVDVHLYDVQVQD